MRRRQRANAELQQDVASKKCLRALHCHPKELHSIEQADNGVLGVEVGPVVQRDVVVDLRDGTVEGPDGPGVDPVVSGDGTEDVERAQDVGRLLVGERNNDPLGPRCLLVPKQEVELVVVEVPPQQQPQPQPEVHGQQEQGLEAGVGRLGLGKQEDDEDPLDPHRHEPAARPVERAKASRCAALGRHQGHC